MPPADDDDGCDVAGLTRLTGSRTSLTCIAGILRFTFKLQMVESDCPFLCEFIILLCVCGMWVHVLYIVMIVYHCKALK